MSQYTLETDQELRVIENPYDGYRGVGIRKSVKAPSETLKNHVKAFADFKGSIELLLQEFHNQLRAQEHEIDQQIEHNCWWLGEMKNYSWGHNKMLDEKRLLYIRQNDALKRERRSLRWNWLKEKRTLLKDRLDAERELSPFAKLF